MDEDVPSEALTDAEVIHAFIDARLNVLHTAFPAKVQSYDASKQTCSVVPQLNSALPDGSGNYVGQTLPTLQDVPVCFPRSGGFFCSFPLQAGDFVLVVCAQRNLGAWRSTGQQGDPGDLGMHTLDGAIAIPGVYPDGKALNNADSQNMVLGSDISPAGRIVLKQSAVEVGGNTSAAVLDTLIADLKSWVAAVNTVVQSNCAAPGAPLVGAAAVAATLAAFAAAINVAGAYRSTVVKHG